MFPTWTTFQQRLARPPRRRPLRNACRPHLVELEPRLAPANVDVLTHHNDNFLSGSNPREEVLTPATVNPRDFGRLHSYPVDGYTYAQPLYKGGLVIPGKGTCNVVFVATQHNSVYAFDADNPTSVPTRCGGQYWHRSFINPAAGITTVPWRDVIGNDIVPEIGITGTPVIDAKSLTLYVASMTREVRGKNVHYVHKLYALDLATGADRVARAVIGDSRGDGASLADHMTGMVLPGSGPGSFNGVVPFNALRALQRPALTINNGLVYVAWASHGDNGPYRGWVAGFRSDTLQLAKWFTTVRNFRGTGIWQSGGGLAHDSQHNIYFATGNAFGTNPLNPPAGNYTEAVLKLCSTVTSQCQNLPTNGLAVADWFVPWNWRQLDAGDADLGSGGVMLFPDQPGPVPRLMVQTGKEGKIYLMDRDNLGQNVPPPGPDRVLQTLEQGITGVWGNPAFFNQDPGGTNRGLMYYQGSGDFLKGFTLLNGRLNPTPIRSNTAFGFPGGQPSVTSDGVKNALVWTLKVDAFGTRGPGVLYAHRAETLGTEIYHSGQSGLRDRAGGAVKFTVPTVSNGKVFVGTQTSLDVYGLFAPSAVAPPAPVNVQAMALSDTQVHLTWANPKPGPTNGATGIRVERSPDGVNFTQVALVARDQTAFTDAGLQATTRYYYRLRATNQVGDSRPSKAIRATTRQAAPRLAVLDTCSSQVMLAWNSVADDRYEVERSVDNFTFDRVATVPASQTSYVDATVKQQPYYYRVRAFSVSPPDVSLSNTVTARVGPTLINYIQGFPPAPGDLRANGSAQFADNTARLNNLYYQAGSVFSTSRVNIQNWTNEFVIRLHEGTQPNPADGLTFTIQADPRGPAALGFSDGGLGYAGITNSVAIKFDVFDSEGETDNSTGLFHSGYFPSLPHGVPDQVNVPLNPNVMNLRNQNTKLIEMAYDGATLTVTITNTFTKQSVRQAYTVDIADYVGGNTAYVGFTGGTFDQYTLQDILRWRFAPTLPAAPRDLRAVPAGAKGATVQWGCSSADEDGFRLERSRDNVNFAQIAEVGPGVTTYKDSGLSSGIWYYRVRAFNTSGTSGYSNTTAVVLGPRVDVAYATFKDPAGLRANGAAAFPGKGDPVARLTSGDLFHAAGSVFTIRHVNVFNFHTSFVFQIRPGTNPMADGLMFVIQADPRGAAALGPAGGGLGYGTDNPDGPLAPDRVVNSVGIKFDTYPGYEGESSNSTGLFTDGRSPTLPRQPGDVHLDLDGTGIDLRSTRLLRVDVAYDGFTLDQTITDTVTGAAFTTSYAVDLRRKLGGVTAHVGFTAGTSELTASHDILSWTGSFLDPVQPTTRLVVEGFPSPSTAGDVGVFVVTAQDAFGNVTPDYRGTVRFRSSDRQAFLEDDYTFTGEDAGIHYSYGYMLTAGYQEITAEDTADGTIVGSQTDIFVSPAPAVTFYFDVPLTVAAGKPFLFTVYAVDPFGNVDWFYRGTVSFLSSDFAAVLPPDYTFEEEDYGSRTFSAILFEPGLQWIYVYDTVDEGLNGLTYIEVCAGGGPRLPNRFTPAAGGNSTIGSPVRRTPGPERPNPSAIFDRESPAAHCGVPQGVPSATPEPWPADAFTRLPREEYFGWHPVILCAASFSDRPARRA